MNNLFWHFYSSSDFVQLSTFVLLLGFIRYYMEMIMQNTQDRDPQSGTFMGRKIPMTILWNRNEKLNHSNGYPIICEIRQLRAGPIFFFVIFAKMCSKMTYFFSSGFCV